MIKIIILVLSIANAGVNEYLEENPGSRAAKCFDSINDRYCLSWIEKHCPKGSVILKKSEYSTYSHQIKSCYDLLPKNLRD